MKCDEYVTTYWRQVSFQPSSESSGEQRNLVQTQVSLTKRRRDIDAYQDILASNAEEFQRLAHMVSDMLFLAKTEQGIGLPHREVISLDQEVRSLFDFYDAVADEKHLQTTFCLQFRHFPAISAR